MKFLDRSCTLYRPALSSFAACTAAAGSVLAPEPDWGRTLVSTVAVFLLACGASALNQVQERRIDALMDRTRQRPVASGDMPPATALALALFLVLPGLALLSLSGVVPLALGCFALLWYNGVYTFLKRRSAFAAVPGAVVGAIPPAIGWAAAGSDLADPRLLALSALLFFWQVPHFWLLAVRYHAEYEHAGLPTPLTLFSLRQIGRITFVWIAATAAVTLLVPFFGLVRSPALYIGLLPIAVWLIWSGSGLLRDRAEETPERALFGRINSYLLAVLAIIAAFHYLEVH